MLLNGEGALLIPQRDEGHSVLQKGQEVSRLRMLLQGEDEVLQGSGRVLPSVQPATCRSLPHQVPDLLLEAPGSGKRAAGVRASGEAALLHRELLEGADLPPEDGERYSGARRVQHTLDCRQALELGLSREPAKTEPSPGVGRERVFRYVRRRDLGSESKRARR